MIGCSFKLLLQPSSAMSYGLLTNIEICIIFLKFGFESHFSDHESFNSSLSVRNYSENNKW